LRAAPNILVLFTALLLLASTPSRSGAVSPVVQPWPHPAGALPASGLGGQPSSLQPDYDEQLGMTFTQGFSTLAYNVTAVQQSDSNGFGPGYLLNGLSSGGYWYQVGIAFDWPYQSGGYMAGFNAIYETFNSSGKSVFPTGGGGGLESLSGPVNDGDRVLLKLSIIGGEVNFFVYDWNTRASAAVSFAAQGSTFVGLSSASGTHGFFTGLMTEWYHVNEYFGSEGKVTYSNPSATLSSAVLWADEFNANTSTNVFGDSQSFTFSNPAQLRIFSLDGATEYADAYEFITGGLGVVTLTLSYLISGGGSGYSSPALTYTYLGKQASANLTGIPTTYLADNGSTWQVTSALLGGGPTERWETAQPTSGTATHSHISQIQYYHQYLVGFAYDVEGGGGSSTPPQATASEFGSSVTNIGNGSAWVDAGSSLTYQALLPGSSSAERWASVNNTRTVSNAQSFTATYYHQYGLTIDYHVAGGSPQSAPHLSGTQFGSAYSAAVSNSTTYFLDAGSYWSLPSLLAGSSSGERWSASTPVNGSASGPATRSVTYRQQFAVTTAVFPAEGGTAESTSWADAGTSVTISATAAGGWKLISWTGTGPGSYSGTDGSPTVLVSAPISEKATFYPGLTIDAGTGGAVTYSSSAGNGTLAQGSSTTVYVPKGSTITLQAKPSAPFFGFSGWGDSGSGSGATLSPEVDSPETISASFSLSPLTLGLAVLALAGVAATLAVVLRRRQHLQTPSPSL
jgi:List-Bact-rpt repeat protein